MKRELVIHFSFLIAFFVLITLFRQWFALSFWPFWLGGIIGTFLPDVDHLIYIYFFGPHELTTLRVNHALSKKDVWGTLNLLAATRSERRKLVFHTAFFQIIFLIFAFWVITSSASLLGRGLVLAFTLHLSVDQLVDLMEMDSLVNWFSQPPIVVDLPKEKATFYWLAGLLIVLFFGFLL